MNLPVGKLKHDFLKELLPTHDRNTSVVVGPQLGEDAAVVEFGDNYLVATSDPITFATEDIGWYVVCVNSNDIAAMGAVPKWLLVTLLLPEDATTPAMVRDIMAQLTQACAEFDIALWYGDVEKAGYAVEPFLTMTRVPTCSEAFAEKHELAEDATRLRDCSLIHEFDYSDWMHCFESVGLDPMDAAHGIVTDNFELTIQSALNDVGVALLFENIAETITSRARLIHPMGSTIAVPVQYSMLIQECRRDDPAVHGIAEFLRACARSPTDRRVEEASPLH